jgi:hypothetical protein
MMKFVIAHYEMKQRKGGREGPILHTWELD